MNAAPLPRGDATDTKQRLLEAANRVVVRDGAAHLTLDAVAAEAGVSKGGVLYHFPSKDALIQAMLNLLLCGFEEELSIEPTGAGAGSWTRAYLTATDQLCGDHRDLDAALLAAAATDPAFVEPMRERWRAWQERSEDDGLDPALATAIRLAADGLWLADLFDLAPPTGALRERVLATLVALTEETTR